MKIAPGETRGNRVPASPPSRRVGGKYTNFGARKARIKETNLRLFFAYPYRLNCHRIASKNSANNDKSP
jgi:hypothetical protein